MLTDRIYTVYGSLFPRLDQAQNAGRAERWQELGTRTRGLGEIGKAYSWQARHCQLGGRHGGRAVPDMGLDVDIDLQGREGIGERRCWNLGWSCGGTSGIGTESLTSPVVPARDLAELGGHGCGLDGV